MRTLFPHSQFLLEAASQLLCADEKLDWSREPLFDSEARPLYTNSRARNDHRSDDYQA